MARTAFKIILFSTVFSSFGLCAASVLMEKAFYKVENRVEQKLTDTLISIQTIFKDEQKHKDALIKREYLHLNVTKKLGAKDLSLTNKSKLEKVHGQKKELSENIALVRFIKSK